MEMRSKRLVAALLLAVAPLLLAARAHGEDGRQPGPASTALSENERAFAAMLKGAVLEGVWQMTGEGGLGSSEPLTDPKKERYTIDGLSKIGENAWLVHARIQVGEKDVSVPVPVQVLFAGDTPVLTVDRIGIPGMGTYSARVMFFRGFYSGAWLSDEKGYGGVMSGRVIPQVEQHREKTRPTPGDDSGK